MAKAKKWRPQSAPRRELMVEFAKKRPNHPAVVFNNACVDAGVHLSTAADASGVSKYSLYLWVCGLVDPSPQKVTILRRLTAALKAAVKAGDLPAMDKDADVVQLLRRHL